MFGPAALRGAFALHAQVDPLPHLDPPAQPHVAAGQPRQRHPTVGRQQAHALVRHQPVPRVELDLFRLQARLGAGFAAGAQHVRAALQLLDLTRFRVPDRWQGQPQVTFRLAGIELQRQDPTPLVERRLLVRQ